MRKSSRRQCLPTVSKIAIGRSQGVKPTLIGSNVSERLLMGQHNSPSQVTGVNYLSQNSDGRSNDICCHYFHHQGTVRDSAFSIGFAISNRGINNRSRWPIAAAQWQSVPPITLVNVNQYRWYHSVPEQESTSFFQLEVSISSLTREYCILDFKFNS